MTDGALSPLSHSQQQQQVTYSHCPHLYPIVTGISFFHKRLLFVTLHVGEWVLNIFHQTLEQKIIDGEDNGIGSKHIVLLFVC